jgi:hypothetical protein
MVVEWDRKRTLQGQALGDLIQQSNSGGEVSPLFLGFSNEMGFVMMSKLLPLGRCRTRSHPLLPAANEMVISGTNGC